MEACSTQLLRWRMEQGDSTSWWFQMWLLLSHPHTTAVFWDGWSCHLLCLVSCNPDIQPLSPVYQRLLLTFPHPVPHLSEFCILNIALPVFNSWVWLTLKRKTWNNIICLTKIKPSCAGWNI
jgi:hypothetical protein